VRLVARRAGRAVAGAVGLYVALRLVTHSAPPRFGFYVYGAIVGLLYALVAFGLILIHRANRIVNFAIAEIGAAAAALGLLLIKSRYHVPYLLALAITLATAVLAGLVVEVTIIRRFARSPRLILSVATIGIGFVFAGIQLVLPKAITGNIVDPAPPRTPLTGLKADLWGVTLDANFLLIVIAVVGVVIGLSLFFRFTDIGLAVRASAENSERASLLGIPVRRVSTVVWIIAAAMAGLGVFLRGPVIGLPVGAQLGPTVLLFGLAAAVLARMESFTVALGAAMAFGVIEQVLYAWNRDPSLGAALVLPILLASMLFQRGTTSRGRDTGMATWSLAKEFRPIPPELKATPEIRAGLPIALGALLVAALLAPLGMSLFQQNVASVVVIYGIVGVSLVVLIGWAGQISLGQWGFVGFGGATAGFFAAHLHADFFVSILAAGVVGGLAAVAIGVPALRIQGLYLAVTTLAFAIAVQVYVVSPNYASWLLPDRSLGITRPLVYGRFDLGDDRTFYYLTLVVLALALLSARSLRNSRTGRVLVASRDNERGAQSYGVSVARARLTAFAYSGFWAGLAGGLFAYQEGNIDTLAFGAGVSFDVLIMVVIGGLTSLPGAILGTLVIGYLKYGNLSEQTQFFATGVGVLVILLFQPGGLAQTLYDARDRLLRLVADRHGIHVPSLVADSRAGVDVEPGPPDGGDVVVAAAEHAEAAA
jgi:branched-chain amino acid transport system permease protein